MTNMVLNERDTFIRGHRVRNREYKRNQIALRPWFVIDGEGITVENDLHLYVQFAGMASDTQESYELVDAKGIDGYRILSALIKWRAAYSHHIFVIYGGSYDFNMWLKQLDLSRDDLERIYKGLSTRIGYGYRIHWRRGKLFTVTHIPTRTTVTIYDVVSFFQCTFVKACDSYLGERFFERELIVKSKEQRGDFTADGLGAVSRYNNAELINLALLMDELRSRLYKVELYPSRWDGPGAIAAYLMKRESIKKARAVTPEPVAEAARYAYAGGRFEVIRFGHFTKPAYEYDVNSAYPTALLQVPDLNHGTWVQGESSDFALYRLRYHWPRSDIPAPLFRRLKTGVVHFPTRGDGWYWSPEYNAALEYQKLYGGTLEVVDSWAFHPTGDHKPFRFIQELYRERMALKKANDGAQVGIKLALNSLYGKLAQQLGWRIQDGEPKIPPFHQLEWAGYVTSHCRATVLRAAMNDLENVIAYETDALFTKQPLTHLSIGENLGEWDLIKFDNLTYLQSGTYYGEVNGELVTAKTRGIDRGKMTRAECIRLMQEPLAADREVIVNLRRFHTLGVGLAQNLDKWCKWLDITKRVSVEPTGKRFHSPFCKCQNDGLQLDFYHETFCPTLDAEMSVEYPIEWLNPAAVELMNTLAELRHETPEYEPLDMYAE